MQAYLFRLHAVALIPRALMGIRWPEQGIVICNFNWILIAMAILTFNE